MPDKVASGAKTSRPLPIWAWSTSRTVAAQEFRSPFDFRRSRLEDPHRFPVPPLLLLKPGHRLDTGSCGRPPLCCPFRPLGSLDDDAIL